MRHPRERRSPVGDATRRDFLLRAGAGALALSGSSAFLEACGNTKSAEDPAGGGSSGDGRQLGPGGIPIARRDSPVTLPLYDDNPAIASGMSPETGGTLKIYNWADYLWRKVANDFGDEFGVQVEISVFNNMDEALAKLSTGAVDYDLMFPTIDALPKFVAGKLLQPLNREYIPNLEQYVWPELVDPFYDKGSRYTVPYTVYTTGIGWRTDNVEQAPDELENPYEIFWNAPWADGKMALLDDYREAMSMVLLKNGVTDINTEDAAQIDRVRDELVELADVANIKTNVSGYEQIPAGRSYVSQVWSGDLVSAQYYMEKGVSPNTLRYWYPPEGGGVIGSDTMGVLKTAKKPVLAHMFLNYLLDKKVALDNFSWVGYQPPQTSIDPDRLAAQGYVPKNLTTSIVRPEDFSNAYSILPLTPDGDARWHDAWAEFKAG
jgi:spermidine/putrescine transport system substrate-binding protein